MTVELSLILLLLLCVITLTYLLYRRINKERKQSIFMQDLSGSELSDYMQKNSLEGSIGEVARMFSGILRTKFKCEYIIFLRKKRGVLELNYYHGIKSFNRADFKIEYSTVLKDVLKENYFPRNIQLIEKFLPDKFRIKINSFKMDKFFPVFWRDNLYGFYLIKSNREINSESFKPVIAQLVQSLSAAYHIKWHESKLENMLQSSKISHKVTEGEVQVDRVLKLLKFKKTDAMITQIVNSLVESTQLDNLVFMYDSKKSDSTQVIYYGNSLENLNNPNNDEFHKIFDVISQRTIISLDKLPENMLQNLQLINNLKKCDIDHIVSFPLSNTRKGILAWKQGRESKRINERISHFKKYFVDVFENVAEHESLEELSFTDNLTSLSNSRYFYKRINEELNRAERYNRHLALIIFDIDELKQINDTYGHQAGDEIIRHIGNILNTSIRTIDVVARYGGDEFCIIMPEADLDTCLKFVNRLHSKIVNSSFPLEKANKVISCTISMGVSIYPNHAQDYKDLIYQADMALLKAKESGRNKILVASESLKTE